MTASIYGIVFAVLGLFCHQMPERSWFLFGAQAPLCIRCSGVLLGAVAAAIYLFLKHRTPSLRLSALLASLLLVDVATQVAGLRDGNNWLRFATGFGFGLFSLMGLLQFLASRAELAARRGRLATGRP